MGRASVPDATRADERDAASGLDDEVGVGLLGHLGVGQDRLDLLRWDVVDSHHFYRLIYFLSVLVLEDTQKSVGMIKHQELVQLNVRQVLVISVYLNLVRPAVVLVFLAHAIHLLIVVSQLLRQASFSSQLLGRFTRVNLVNLEIDRLLALAHLKVKAYTFVTTLWSTHANEVLPIVEAQSHSGLLKVDRLVVSDHAPGSLHRGRWLLWLQVELVNL